MENLEKPLYIYPTEQIEDIALRASEMDKFKDAIKGVKSKLEAIKKTRELLPQSFPEIDTLPLGQRTDAPNRIGPRYRNPLDTGPLRNDYLVAKNLVDLLWEDK